MGGELPERREGSWTKTSGAYRAVPPRSCAQSLENQIEGAQRLQATDPAASNWAWIEIEHRLDEEAMWAPLNQRTPRVRLLGPH